MLGCFDKDYLSILFVHGLIHIIVETLPICMFFDTACCTCLLKNSSFSFNCINNNDIRGWSWWHSSCFYSLKLIHISTISNSKEAIMSKKSVEDLLVAGGADEGIRLKYDVLKTMEDFTEVAGSDGYEFAVTDLEEVLRESGDSFESIGNPAKKLIWWY